MAPSRGLLAAGTLWGIAVLVGGAAAIIWNGDDARVCAFMFMGTAILLWSVSGAMRWWRGSAFRATAPAILIDAYSTLCVGLFLAVMTSLRMLHPTQVLVVGLVILNSPARFEGVTTPF